MRQEDVIKALECCIQNINGEESKCSKCPYRDRGAECTECLMVDALVMLKRGPHVLALDEAIKRSKTGEYVYLQDTHCNVYQARCAGWPEASDYGANSFIKLYGGFGDGNVFSVKGYGESWVAWSSYPSWEQQKMVFD